MFDKLKKSIRQFGKDERGVTAVEYAVIAVAMSTMLLTFFNSNTGIKSTLTSAVTAIQSNITSAGTKQ